jgi:hypothetical protein
MPPAAPGAGAVAPTQAASSSGWSLDAYSRALGERNARGADPAAPRRNPLHPAAPVPESGSATGDKAAPGGLGLLPNVPVVPWGPDLAYWGVKSVPVRRANGFGMRHWWRFPQPRGSVE